MSTSLGSLLAALVLASVVASVDSARAQGSAPLGAPPSPYHVWVPARRVWDGRREVRTPGRWERRAYRRAEPQPWHQHQREEEGRARWEERRRHRR
jgi:hypothetical protein